MAFDVLGQTLLVDKFDADKFFQSLHVLVELLQVLQDGHVGNPIVLGLNEAALLEVFRYEVRELRVALGDPAARGDAIRYIQELIGPDLGEVVENGVADDLAVQCRDAVHGVRADDGEIRHAHIAATVLVDEGHVADGLLGAALLL